VYVCDNGNNRVVRFPAGTDVADAVWGAPSLSSTGPAAVPPTASSLNAIENVALYDGGLFVCDGGNNRLVFYTSPSAPASRLWGQPNFVTAPPAIPPTASSLNTPNVVVFNGGGTMMFVADTGIPFSWIVHNIPTLPKRGYEARQQGAYVMVLIDC
jgi:hypothetical protein